MATESLIDRFDMWKNRMQVAKKQMDDLAPEWEEYKSAYEGEEKHLFHKRTRRYHMRTTLNWTHIDVRSAVPTLFNQTPEINIDPEEPESDLHAEIMEKVVNILKDKRWKLGPRMRDLVKGSKLTGRDYLKVYYNFKKKDIPRIGTNFEGEKFNDEIMIDWVSRETVLTPSDMTSFNAASWVAHEIRIPLKEGKKKFNLKEGDKPATTTERNDYIEKLPQDQKQDFEYMTYYEIEDRENRELSVIVKGIDRFMVKPYEFPYPYYSMYIPLEWNSLPGRGDTKADPHFWWGKQLELSEIQTQQLNHRRKLNAKYKSRGPELSDEQISALKSGDDSIVVPLKANQDVEPFTHASLGQEVYLMENNVRQDLGVQSAVSEQKTGSPQKKKTAREAVLIAASAQTVTVDRATEVEKVVNQAMTKAILLIQKFYDRTRVIRLTGMEEVEFLNLKDRVGEKLKEKVPEDFLSGSAEMPFIKFVGNQMKGEMSVRISSGSTLPTDEESKKADMALYFQLGQQFPPLFEMSDPKELSKELVKLLHFQNKNIIIEPTSPEQENVLLKRNIPVMPSINENHDQHVQVHGLESNNTPAFLNHMLGHQLMQSHQRSSQPQGGGQGLPEQPKDLQDLATEGIPGTPQVQQAQQTLPEQAPQAVSPGVQQQPPPTG